MDDSDDSPAPIRVVVKPSAVDGNTEAKEITESAGTVLTFDSRDAAETEAACLSDFGDVHTVLYLFWKNCGTLLLYS